MKIMWICSFAPARVAEAAAIPQNIFGGWVDGAIEQLLSVPDVKLAVCFPLRGSKAVKSGSDEALSYYGVPLRSGGFEYDPEAVGTYAHAIRDFQPDVIHFWGAEFPFFLAAVEAAPDKTRLVCSIQGLCGMCAKHYFAYLPEAAIHRITFRDFVRRDNLGAQQRAFVQRGEYEQRILAQLSHVIGRTEWDRACTELLVPSARYHVCNETLRNVFYENTGSWRYDRCEKHSIFVSQASYPIKGFHLVLEAFPEILSEYPDTVIYTTGQDPFSQSKLRISSYQQYLLSLLSRPGIREHVSFLGTLDAGAMCNRYLRSQVFVSASSIENSSNSVGEAMLLGVPVVASYVGGTMTLLRHGEEGYLYQADAPYMLAHYVKKVFAAGPDAEQMGKAAAAHAGTTHAREKNLLDLLSIYREISEQEPRL